MNVDSVLEEFVEDRQIPIFGIASANGFEHALPGWHPKQLMPRCKNVLVFGRPLVEYPLHVDEKTHIANQSWWAANEAVYRDVARWRGEMINLFDEFGLGTANLRFVLKVKQRYEDSVKICSRCFTVCPWAKQMNRGTSST